jgi:nitroreductase
LVQDPKVKEQLAAEAMLGAGNQYRTKDASVIAFFLSDLEVTKRIDRIQQLEHCTRDSNYANVFPIAASFLAGEGHVALALKQAATSLLSRGTMFLANRTNGRGQPMPTIEPVQAWTYKNSALMAQTYVLAATSHELATCIMEGYDGRRVKEVLRIPDRYDIPMAVATGYDYDCHHHHGNDLDERNQVQRTVRLPLQEVCFRDSFAVPMILDENSPSRDD